MAVLFRGRFESKLDPKGRLILPASFRHILPAKDHRLVITNSQHKGLRSLDVLSYEAWENLEKRIQRLSPLKAEVQAFQRMYISAGQVLEPDSQSRLLIPQSLRQHAGLENEIVMVGMAEKFEIWSLSTWNRLYESLSAGFDDTLAAVARLEEVEA